MKTQAFNLLPFLTIGSLVFGQPGTTSQALGQPLTSTPFSALYCFGFSWTDTRASDWNPPMYYRGHPSNGPMWPEVLSTNLGMVYIPTNNYARVGADSAGVLSQVNQLKVPVQPSAGLYVLWCGGGDFLYGASSLFYPTRTLSTIHWTNDASWDALILNTLRNSSNAVQRLYTIGARSIVVQNCFDLSSFPALIDEFGSNHVRGARLRERISRFNQALLTTLNSISQAKPDLRLIEVDIETRLGEVINSPSSNGLTKAYPDALDDATLTDKSFTGPGKDYIFWDGLHGTSKTHSLVAGWVLNAITNTVAERLAISTASLGRLTIFMSALQIGHQYTLQGSGDLRSWNDAQTFIADAGTNSWAPPVGNDGRAAYFRIAW